MANNNDELPPTDSWCRTKACEEVKYTFTWIIDKFSDRPEENAQVNITGMNVDFQMILGMTMTDAHDQ